MENHDSGVGIYAPDAEAYTTFADLFDPIIEDYHGGFKKTDKHPARDWGDVDTFQNLDPAVSATNNVNYLTLHTQNNFTHIKRIMSLCTNICILLGFYFNSSLQTPSKYQYLI